jgi:hypothetical protein
MVCPVAAAVDGSTQPFTMPTGDRGRLNQHQCVPPPRPPPSEGQPEQTVRWANASIRTSEDRQLVAQCKTLKKEVSTHGQGCPEPRDLPKGGLHRP